MAQRKFVWPEEEPASVGAVHTDIYSKPDLVLLSKRATTPSGKVYQFAKRSFDIVSSVCLLLLIWPAFILIAIAIKFDSKGPVIYRHERVGYNFRRFLLLKFRTMVVNADEMLENFTPKQRAEWEANFKLDDDPRITRVGRFLRKTSLDELPQLLNIIRGDLSVVGPRPVVRRELERYGKNKSLFLSVKPGLTGNWQANARNSCCYEERMQMELHYARQASFLWDMRIILATFRSVFIGRGAK